MWSKRAKAVVVPGQLYLKEIFLPRFRTNSHLQSFARQYKLICIPTTGPRSHGAIMKRWIACAIGSESNGELLPSAMLAIDDVSMHKGPLLHVQKL
jgi:hypothetical protein